MAEKYYSISPYAYVLNNPLKYTDPNGDTVRIYTETEDFGHAWMSVGEGKNMTVYTYGRYGHVNEEFHGIRGISNGEGVLVKLTGQGAIAYNESKSEKTDVSVFQITDVSDDDIKTFFETKFNSSEERPKEGVYKNSKNARVIDEYKLLSNNCTTIVADALINSGSDALALSPFKGEQILTKRPIMPRVMQNILTGKSLIPFTSVKKTR